MARALAKPVAELLATRVDSFDKLEIVVALHRAPGTSLSIEQLARHLSTTRDAVRTAVAELRDAALVEIGRSGEIQLLPPTQQERATVAELVRLYEVDRITLVAALGEVALDRIRSMASHMFVLPRKKDS